MFVRGATEGINLVAQSWGGPNLKPGDRIMLSVLEHHSNIVPWQLIAERTGGRSTSPVDRRRPHRSRRARGDADRAPQARRPRPCLERARLGARRAARAAIAHRVGAKLLLDGCQAVPRMPVDVAAIGCDFYVFSAHKLYGPTGIGVSGRAATSSTHAALAGRRRDDREGDLRAHHLRPPPARFEAGTPPIVGAIGLHAAIDYVAGIGLDAIARTSALVREARARCRAINRRPPVRPRRQRRHRQLRGRGGASARRRHHIGREPGRDPRRPSLRAAADGPSRRRRDRAGELGVYSDSKRTSRLWSRRRTGETESSHERRAQDRDRGSRRGGQADEARVPPASRRRTPEFRAQARLSRGLSPPQVPRPPGGRDRAATCTKR